MALSSNSALIGDSSLEDWTVIDSGGFGQIFKSRHVHWGLDVAIKLLHRDDGSSSSLQKEAELMCAGSSPHVLRILGVYRGRPPPCGPSLQLGLVMEFMERGSLAKLQENLGEPLPLALAFRMAHQVALGMNYLHSLSPPLLHLDLKPSNVLLDDSLNAKLSDFGLARYYRNISQLSRRDDKDEGGTCSYMPPEAFNTSYKPTCASDIYSYGILLWSIFSGKPPYPDAFSSVIRFRIPMGDRPALDEVDQRRNPLLAEIVDLMERCWVSSPVHRPPFLECITVTETLYKMHRREISHAQSHVLQQLRIMEEQKQNTEGATLVHLTQPPYRVERLTKQMLNGRPPVQEMAGGRTTNQKEVPSIKEEQLHHLKSSSSIHRTHSPTNQQKNVHSLPPNGKQNPAPFPVPERASQNKTLKPPPVAQTHLGYQRQVSNPEATRRHARPGGTVSINMSNVTGVQIGNGNEMYITEIIRRRHPTAPPSVNLMPPASKKQKGRVLKS